MAFMVKSVVGGQLKNLTGGLGGGEEKGESEKTPAEAHGMTREEYEEYQKQLVEEKMERDAQFAQRKAERATLRTHFRDKYRLPKETDRGRRLPCSEASGSKPRSFIKKMYLLPTLAANWRRSSE
uniref:Complexin-3 n=1 Tax=Sphaerodactylus townsendi TaxID=933632 RepID=A0ACB8E553_9SAUR